MCINGLKMNISYLFTIVQSTKQILVSDSEWPEGGVSQYRQYFLFRTIRVEYSFVTSLMMLRKDETVGTYATGGIEPLRSNDGRALETVTVKNMKAPLKLELVQKQGK